MIHITYDVSRNTTTISDHPDVPKVVDQVLPTTEERISAVETTQDKVVDALATVVGVVIV